jgi:hypothetical protein
LQSPADAEALPQILAPLMPELFKAEDAIGTVHYSRFTVLSDKTLLFLADFDGEFGQLMLALTECAGPAFGTIFGHVDGPPPMPVAKELPGICRMDSGPSPSSFEYLQRLPGVTVKEINALAAARVEGPPSSCRSWSSWRSNPSGLD